MAPAVRVPPSRWISPDRMNADQLIARALRCLEERACYGEFISDYKSLSAYLRLQLAPEKNEVFAVVFLDNNHRVLAFEKMFFGTINCSFVHPRVVAQRALAHNAAAVIFAHNHPALTTKPSESDKQITQKLKTVLELIDVHVLDHMIVTLNSSFSFAEHDLL